jgi:hypothetical protein
MSPQDTNPGRPSNVVSLPGHSSPSTPTGPARSEDLHLANRLLAALKPEDFSLVERNLEIVTLKPAEILYEAGDDVRYAYFPHDGMVSPRSLPSLKKGCRRRWPCSVARGLWASLAHW